MLVWHYSEQAQFQIGLRIICKLRQRSSNDAPLYGCQLLISEVICHHSPKANTNFKTVCKVTKGVNESKDKGKLTVWIHNSKFHKKYEAILYKEETNSDIYYILRILTV